MRVTYLRSDLSPDGADRMHPQNLEACAWWPRPVAHAGAGQRDRHVKPLGRLPLGRGGKPAPCWPELQWLTRRKCNVCGCLLSRASCASGVRWQRVSARNNSDVDQRCACLRGLCAWSELLRNVQRAMWGPILHITACASGRPCVCHSARLAYVCMRTPLRCGACAGGDRRRRACAVCALSTSSSPSFYCLVGELTAALLSGRLVRLRRVTGDAAVRASGKARRGEHVCPCGRMHVTRWLSERLPACRTVPHWMSSLHPRMTPTGVPDSKRNTTGRAGCRRPCSGGRKAHLCLGSEVAYVVHSV
jgi:hypothetical protein